MEEIDFFEEGEGGDFTFYFQKPFLAHFSITFLSAIQILVWYKNLSYFFAETHRLEAPLERSICILLVGQCPRKCLTDTKFLSFTVNGCAET